MKIVIIHGQSHKGSTYHIARMLAEKIGGDINGAEAVKKSYPEFFEDIKKLCEKISGRGDCKEL